MDGRCSMANSQMQLDFPQCDPANYGVFERRHDSRNENL
jgi:hypothetical protein